MRAAAHEPSQVITKSSMKMTASAHPATVHGQTGALMYRP